MKCFTLEYLMHFSTVKSHLEAFTLCTLNCFDSFHRHSHTDGYIRGNLVPCSRTPWHADWRSCQPSHRWKLIYTEHKINRTVWKGWQQTDVSWILHPLFQVHASIYENTVMSFCVSDSHAAAYCELLRESLKWLLYFCVTLSIFYLGMLKQHLISLQWLLCKPSKKEKKIQSKIY